MNDEQPEPTIAMGIDDFARMLHSLEQKYLDIMLAYEDSRAMIQFNGLLHRNIGPCEAMRVAMRVAKVKLGKLIKEASSSQAAIETDIVYAIEDHHISDDHMPQAIKFVKEAREFVKAARVCPDRKMPLRGFKVHT